MSGVAVVGYARAVASFSAAARGRYRGPRVTPSQLEYAAEATRGLDTQAVRAQVRVAAGDAQVGELKNRLIPWILQVLLEFAAGMIGSVVAAKAQDWFEQKDSSDKAAVEGDRACAAIDQIDRECAAAAAGVIEQLTAAVNGFIGQLAGIDPVAQRGEFERCVAAGGSLIDEAGRCVADLVHNRDCAIAGCFEELIRRLQGACVPCEPEPARAPRREIRGVAACGAGFERAGLDFGGRCAVAVPETASRPEPVACPHSVVREPVAPAVPAPPPCDTPVPEPLAAPEAAAASTPFNVSVDAAVEAAASLRAEAPDCLPEENLPSAVTETSSVVPVDVSADPPDGSFESSGSVEARASLRFDGAAELSAQPVAWPPPTGCCLGATIAGIGQAVLDFVIHAGSELLASFDCVHGEPFVSECPPPPVEECLPEPEPQECPPELPAEHPQPEDAPAPEVPLDEVPEPEPPAGKLAAMGANDAREAVPDAADDPAPEPGSAPQPGTDAMPQKAGTFDGEISASAADAVAVSEASASAEVSAAPGPGPAGEEAVAGDRPAAAPRKAGAW